MAPEQIEGGAADARSDIFGFGAVLYEMTTGRRAFTGDSTASVIGAVLKDRPTVRFGVGSRWPLRRLDELIMRCLEKDPENRWQSARDIVLELQTNRERPGVTDLRAPQVHRGGADRIAWAVAGASILAMMGAALAVTRRSSSRSDPKAEQIHFTVVPSDNATIITAAVSPNGKRIALVADTAGRTQLWVRALDDVQLRRTRGYGGSHLPFLVTRQQIHRLLRPGQAENDRRRSPERSTSSATPRTLAAAPGAATGRSSLLAGTGQGLSRVSADGGVPQPQTTLEPSRRESSHRWPAFLPRRPSFRVFRARAENLSIRGSIWLRSTRPTCGVW